MRIKTRTIAALAVAALALMALATGGSAARLVAPTNTAPPTISGTAQENSTLTTNEGTWTGSPTFTYAWLRCDKDGGSCSTISGANDKTYTLKTVDNANTLRVRVTGRNADGSNSATSVPTGVVAAAAAPQPAPSPNGCTGQSSGSGTVQISNVALPQRLLIDHFSVNPGVVHRNTNDLSVQVHVTTTCGGSVSGALVYATGVPFNQFSIPSEGQTDANGMVTLQMHRLGGFPAARNQHLFVMMIRARKSGENVLAGVSTRRLVSSRVDLTTAV